MYDVLLYCRLSGKYSWTWVAMRSFSVQGRTFAALIILSDYNDFDAMEVVETIDGVRGERLLEFRLYAHSACLSTLGPEVEIPLLRASTEIFREEFLEPRQKAGLPCPPW
ncbi:hypothetical protein [Kitasatospora sp. NPDC050543]|uniref:hypothetical protein n=1 Tax=Kitasatospora sp. NPDC050543 TaxID=3364054 RepID=UPI0037B54CFB